MNHIPSLNGLRALSILFVLFAHVLLKSFNFSDNPGGQIGVTIFFVISGYLITLLLLREEKNNGRISLSDFYLRRAIRILPVYYFLLLVYSILQASGYLTFSVNSWIASLTYTKYLQVNDGGDWESGHLWSLSVEQHFYFIWPLVFSYLKNYRIHFAFLVIVLVTIARFYSNLPVMHMLTRADALMVGCVLALYNDQLTHFFKTRHRVFSVAPFVILLLALLSKRIVESGEGSFEKFTITFLGSYGLITNLTIGAIILVSIHFRDNVWFNFLNAGPLDYIGKISYSIYLWQQLFFSTSLGKLSIFPLNIVLIFLVASFSFHFIEKPILDLRLKLKRPRIVAA
jgi:peptidoglycan/LPS O-acetylase OafA/YrhL